MWLQKTPRALGDRAFVIYLTAFLWIVDSISEDEERGPEFVYARQINAPVWCQKIQIQRYRYNDAGPCSKSAAGRDATIRYSESFGFRLPGEWVFGVCVCVCVWCIRGKYKYLCGKQQAFCQNICVRTRSNPHSGLNRFLIPACETDLYPEILFTHPILFVFIDASSQIVLSHSVGKEFLRFCGLFWRPGVTPLLPAVSYSMKNCWLTRTR